MNKHQALFGAAALILAVSAILMGHSAGQARNFAVAFAMVLSAVGASLVVGLFTFCALRCRSTPAGPVERVANRGMCRTDWAEIGMGSGKPETDERSKTTEHSEP